MQPDVQSPTGLLTLQVVERHQQSSQGPTLTTLRPSSANTQPQSFRFVQTLLVVRISLHQSLETGFSLQRAHTEHHLPALHTSRLPGYFLYSGDLREDFSSCIGMRDQISKLGTAQCGIQGLSRSGPVSFSVSYPATPHPESSAVSTLGVPLLCKAH